MSESKAPWVAALRNHAARETPVPARETFTEMEEWQYRIVGGALIAWLEHHGPRMLQERAVLANVLGVEKDPTVVFTSDVPGLAAAREILDGSSAPVIAIRDKSLQAFLADHPDPQYRWHVHHWSTFEPVTDEHVLREVSTTHPIEPEATYWLHVEGTLWGTRCGTEGRHLWKWDGHAYELLEEAWSFVQF